MSSKKAPPASNKAALSKEEALLEYFDTLSNDSVEFEANGFSLFRLVFRFKFWIWVFFLTGLLTNITLLFSMTRFYTVDLKQKNFYLTTYSGRLFKLESCPNNQPCGTDFIESKKAQ